MHETTNMNGEAEAIGSAFTSSLLVAFLVLLISVSYIKFLALAANLNCLMASFRLAALTRISCLLNEYGASESSTIALFAIVLLIRPSVSDQTSYSQTMFGFYDILSQLISERISHYTNDKS